MATIKKIKKAQKGKTVDFNTTGDWADNYSLDTTGLAKGNVNYFPYRRSVGTKGVFTRGETKEIVDKVKKGKYKKSDWNFKDGGKMSKAEGGKWIQKAIKKPGALRKQLGAKPGQPIPAGKLAAAAKKPGKIGQRARLAQTLKKISKKK